MNDAQDRYDNILAIALPKIEELARGYLDVLCKAEERASLIPMPLLACHITNELAGLLNEIEGLDMMLNVLPDMKEAPCTKRIESRIVELNLIRERFEYLKENPRG